LNNWTKTRLDEVCSLVTDGTHHSPPNSSSGAYRYVTAKNIRPWGLDLRDISYVDAKTHAEIYARCPVEKNDVLYIKDGVTTGLAVINHLDEPFSMLSSVALLKPMRNVLEPRYLKYWLNSPKTFQNLTGEMTGSAIKRLVLRQIRSAEIDIAPFNEQTRIADQLDKLLARIQSCNDRLDAIPALLKRFRQAVLDAATSGSLTEEWNAENKPTWTAVRLSDVAGEFSYGSAAKSSKTEAVPVLRMGNIQSGRLDWMDLVFTSDLQEIDKYRLRKGDVLFNRTNSPELVGKTAVYQGEREAIYAGYLIRVRCLPTLLPEYLNYCLGSKAGRAYCWSVKSDGVSQSNINAKKLAAFEFLLPSIQEQAEIICRVDNLQKMANRIEASYLAAKSQAQRLISLLLAKAFRGDLVPQDPEDESADLLLKRIKENRENQAPKKMNGRAAKDKPMKSSPTSSLYEVISRMDEDCFTFDQLREVASRDYETLKDELYLLLADSGSGIKQVFDVEKRLMKFKRVRT
jgi:type I restriction enzyme, S subunit